MFHSHNSDWLRVETRWFYSRQKQGLLTTTSRVPLPPSLLLWGNTPVRNATVTGRLPLTRDTVAKLKACRELRTSGLLRSE